MRVAVLGGGFLGACTALELARRGVAVDLYDQNDRLLEQTSTRNEGKIHLGFVYANASFTTARRMIEGAVRFIPLLRRWLGAALDSVPVSDDFVYLVHRDSLVSPDQWLAHARRVAACLEETGTPIDYPGGCPPNTVVPLTRAELAARFNPATVVAAFRTPERAIDVNRLAGVLREAVAGTPRIRVWLGTRVDSAAHVADGITIGGHRDGQRLTETYAHVVNALWDGRPALDARLGFHPAADRMWRLRHAIFVTAPSPIDLPSITAVLGPFGDVVNLGAGRYYLSWYPVCLVGRSTAIEPPAWRREPDPATARDIFERSVAGLAHLVPTVARLATASEVRVRGGIIFAHGQTDIDDPASGLHRRDRVGITSHSGWHSIDPGKYTLAPALACAVAERIRPVT